MIKYLLIHKKTPILAVDADANANFNEVLGVEMTSTLGDAREDMKKGKVPNGITKDIFLSMRMEDAIIEHEGFDLIVMGQPEGPGCYCAANSLLTRILEQLAGNYPYLVMDNEAGMEHISRLTTRNVDVMLIVADASRRGLQAAVRIDALARGLGIGVGNSYLVINQVKADPPDSFMSIILDAGLQCIGIVHEDQTLYDYDLQGKPAIELPLDTPVVRQAFDIFDRIMSD
jgi:CO dehydrogenase maturation factor